jgi:hypothetical protein
MDVRRAGEDQAVSLAPQSCSRMPRLVLVQCPSRPQTVLVRNPGLRNGPESWSSPLYSLVLGTWSQTWSSPGPDS